MINIYTIAIILNIVFFNQWTNFFSVFSLKYTTASQLTLYLKKLEHIYIRQFAYHLN